MAERLKVPVGAFPALDDHEVIERLLGPFRRREREKVKVVFVTSAGRSGSTVLERILGQFDGVWGAGEIYAVWEMGVKNDGRCGCGKRFRSCATWLAVFDRLGGIERVDGARMEAFWRANDRMFGPHFRHLVTAKGRRRLPAATDCTDVLELLFAAMADASGCKVIVDTTKSMFHAAYLRYSDVVDPYLVHLVRDARPVVFSWGNPKPERGYEDERPMPRAGTLKASLWWCSVNQFGGMLGSDYAGRYKLVRYEDFVEAPQKTIDEIGELCGEKWSWDGIADPGEANSFLLRPTHSVWGNPMRFEKGKLKVEPDERWKDRMTPASRRLVGIVCSPWMRKYGYR